MKIAFTICSDNYLAQAKTLGDSIKKTNPEYEFFIGLTDKLSNEIDYENEIGYSIIPVEKIGIPSFADLWKKYSIIELNTCVKPFYFQYFISKFYDLEFLFFLDPDTCIYDNISFIENEFKGNIKILLTPHILTPIQIDDKTPSESTFLNYGVYNLGFLGLKNPTESHDLIKWWKDRTYNLGFNKPEKGLFVDQLWFNLVPIFFDNVGISENPGTNMAPWNLHERSLSFSNSKFIVNNIYPLIFYHFSNYNFTEPSKISDFYDRYNFEGNIVLNKLYKTYHQTLINNRIEKYSKIECEYMILKREFFKNEEKKREIERMKEIMSSPSLKLKYYLKKFIPEIFVRIYKAYKKQKIKDRQIKLLSK